MGSNFPTTQMTNLAQLGFIGKSQLVPGFERAVAKGIFYPTGQKNARAPAMVQPEVVAIQGFSIDRMDLGRTTLGPALPTQDLSKTNNNLHRFVSLVAQCQDAIAFEGRSHRDLVDREAITRGWSSFAISVAGPSIVYLSLVYLAMFSSRR